MTSSSPEQQPHTSTLPETSTAVEQIYTYETPKLTEAIDNLTHLMKDRTSLKYRFFSGLLTGLGTVIGATVLAGAIIYILSLIVSQIDFSEMPTIQKIIEQANLTTTIEKNEKN